MYHRCSGISSEDSLFLFIYFFTFYCTESQQQEKAWSCRNNNSRNLWCEARPKNTWRRDLRAAVERLGCTWQHIEKRANDQGLWWSPVNGLDPGRADRQKSVSCDAYYGRQNIKVCFDKLHWLRSLTFWKNRLAPMTERNESTHTNIIHLYVKASGLEANRTKN